MTYAPPSAPLGFGPVLYRYARAFVLGVLVQAAAAAWCRHVYVEELQGLPTPLVWAMVMGGIMLSLVWLFSWADGFLGELVRVAMRDMCPEHDFSQGRFRTPRLSVLSIYWRYRRADSAVRETFLALADESPAPVTVKLFRVAEAAAS